MRNLTLLAAALLIAGCAGENDLAAAGIDATKQHVASSVTPVEPAPNFEEDSILWDEDAPGAVVWPADIPLPAVGTLTGSPGEGQHRVAWGLEGDSEGALNGYLTLLGSAGFTLIDQQDATHHLASAIWEVTVTVAEQPGGLDIELAATATGAASD